MSLVSLVFYTGSASILTNTAAWFGSLITTNIYEIHDLLHIIHYCFVIDLTIRLTTCALMILFIAISILALVPILQKEPPFRVFCFFGAYVLLQQLWCPTGDLVWITACIIMAFVPARLLVAVEQEQREFDILLGQEID